jgi:hypothetical protein
MRKHGTAKRGDWSYRISGARMFERQYNIHITSLRSNSPSSTCLITPCFSVVNRRFHTYLHLAVPQLDIIQCRNTPCCVCVVHVIVHSSFSSFLLLSRSFQISLNSDLCSFLLVPAQQLIVRIPLIRVSATPRYRRNHVSPPISFRASLRGRELVFALQCRQLVSLHISLVFRSRCPHGVCAVSYPPLYSAPCHLFPHDFSLALIKPRPPPKPRQTYQSGHISACSAAGARAAAASCGSIPSSPSRSGAP